MNSDEVNWLLQTIEDPENANYDTAKDSSCHDALTGTDVIEVLATSPQRRRRTRVRSGGETWRFGRL
jgi:hypothetical protein